MKRKAVFILIIISLIISCSKEDENKYIYISSPYSIKLTSDISLSALPHLASIKADNNENLNFITEVRDSLGQILDVSCSYLKDGQPFSKTSFKSNIPGNYIFEAYIGNIKSNKLEVLVYEVAESYVTIESSNITNINSVWLTTASITFKNISNKRIKYINFNVQCKNQVGDIIYEDITNKSSVSCKATGFFEPNQIKTLSWNVGYFTGVSEILVTLGSIELEDGERIFGYY